MKEILLIASVFLLSACGDGKHVVQETSIGWVSVYQAKCSMGLLLSYDGPNILDRNGVPVTCTGNRAKFSPEEFKMHGAQ